METDSSDSSGDSVKSIPRPDFEALSAIDSPQPQLQESLLDGHNDMETGVSSSSSMPSKRQKYVVSAPPGSANGSSNSSNSSPSNANVGSSLTMKLTKVQPQLQQAQRTSTPNSKSNKVPKEMLALQRSHIESEMLTNFVAEVSKLKRRKSRYVPEPLDTPTPRVELSRSLNTEAKREKKLHKATLKRSKSIPAPNWDSDDDWQDDPDKSRRVRGRSMACDDLLVGETNSNPPPMSKVSARTRSRSKTLSLSNEDRLPRRSNLRSENEEFAKKHSAFLDSVMNDDPESVNASMNTTMNEVDVEADWSSFSENPTDTTENQEEEQVADRLRLIWQAPPMEGWDPFCWKCRECGQLMPCSKCLRSFHTYCVRPATTKFDSSWKCPECQSIEAAPKRLRRNDVSVDLLSQLLFYALERMKHVRGAHKLRSPQEVFPQTYKKYFVNPVSFDSLAECIRRGAYQTTEEFLSEVKWMQHNALILDTGDPKVEQASKAVVKVCRQEANEIDTCPECYLNANSSDEWFVKVCRHPHLLLWAKLKGFPYWPAKAMGSSNSTLVNVRFFGKHDRAFVPVKDCFLYSAQNPNTQTSRRSARDLAECVREVEVHIENIKRKIGAFCYAEYRTAYDPIEEQQQLEQMMPGVYEAIDRELEPANKTPLQFLIRKTADDKLSIVKKTKTTESGNESDQSGSPVKKSPEAPEAVAASEPPPKLNKSNNYEVISRSGESLTDSRCKVLLKRKSLAAKTTSSSVEASLPSPAPTQEALAPAVPSKRKHSLSDTSCTSESSDYKRKAKHAKKQQDQQVRDQPVAEPGEPPKKLSKSPEQTIGEKPPEKQTAKASEASPASVVSVVELVRRRQGVTITKIPRDQQQMAGTDPEPPPTPAVAAPPPTPAAANPSPSTVTKVKAPERSQARKQSEVERQQQQLIKKVIPFVEIKTEVMSEPEEEEATQQLPVPEPEPAQPEPALVSATPPPPEPMEIALPENIKIKEEILSDDEIETDQQQPASVSQRLEAFPPMPQPMPPPPPPPLPPREETPATEALVRYVGDTSIQKVSQKQGGKSSDSNAKRRGPQASSPAISPVPSPAPSTESLSPKSSGIYGPNKPTPPQGPSKSKPSQAQASPQQHQYRVKGDRVTPNPSSSPGAAPATTTTTTSSLLRSNMVVIPVEQANNCNPHNPMTIPVPPLRAVSKSTLQSSAASLQTAPVSTSQPASSISVPPLAGLSFSPLPSTSAAAAGGAQGNGGGEPAGGLLASALNGMTSQEPSLVTEPNDPITPGMATALSEMLLRSGPPKLVARPGGPLQSDGSHIYPSQAGPVSQKLKENAHKITDYFISVIEDTLSDMATGDQSVLQARITGLTLENERLKQHYDRQLTDLQKTSELMLAEMRKTLEQEHRRVISELRQQANIERMRAVDEAKKKQWCANCMREAQLYCCWNTSYCDYPCQQMHWPRHSATCGQAVNVQVPLSNAGPASAMETGRSPKSKAATITPTPAPPPPNVRTPTAACQPPVAPVIGTNSAGKKWPPMMSSIMNQQPPPPNPETTLLKLPSSTYLRPVVSSITATVTATPTVNSSINPMLPSSSGNHMAHLMPGPIQRQNNAANFQPKPASQPMQPVQRYNIPLPITINPSGAPYGLIAEQHHKQQLAPKAKGRRQNNTTIRQINSTGSQGIRPNQMNQVFHP
ncbi:MYND-type zinc finger-containing chromatin reader Zmynd8 [Drosophila kikkawai]|uniref:MYND-type zinc finger-containing chromatin reader Zmynd8 n=1 Tax=Drosophila kikkawai TaxID=30033 RepID=A0A6P4JMP6_DROKI|nr:protein kinase C-binding protein 1 isoform X1 [Drosophila kikkawai]XP_017036911.1 protein kinase C-binding protein 1 isoform X1 [Drosophila kikkawai]